MSFGKFGSRPRSMNNPLYWVGKYRESTRNVARTINAENKRIDRWNRLKAIHQDIVEQFVVPLDGNSASESKVTKMVKLLSEADQYKHEAVNLPSTPETGALSKYATRLKNLALVTIALCDECGIYDDIQDCNYNKDTKTITLKGEPYYYFG